MAKIKETDHTECWWLCGVILNSMDTVKNIFKVFFYIEMKSIEHNINAFIEYNWMVFLKFFSFAYTWHNVTLVSVYDIMIQLCYTLCCSHHKCIYNLLAYNTFQYHWLYSLYCAFYSTVATVFYIPNNSVLGFLLPLFLMKTFFSCFY